jgi:hypothetical protein
MLLVALGHLAQHALVDGAEEFERPAAWDAGAGDVVVGRHQVVRDPQGGCAHEGPGLKGRGELRGYPLISFPGFINPRGRARA